MARSPEKQVSGHPANEEASRAKGATGQAATISLTASAKTYADRQGLTSLLASAGISGDCQTGDIVSVGDADFYILRRRWVLSAGSSRLEITLDHPMRGR
ncbi:hypothetical protein [Hoeflea sp. 108]|jgi:hypothetical protein|uniref:hypothetical protein n=1 Tax=Hoeflea sp. 108 TaxID=1116369 RepID=UPI00036C6EF1|nr:hypothetical protein [Hoeflea sp. 108]